MRYNYNDGSLKIDLDEELDMKACKTLRTVIDGYIMRYQPREFIIDLSDVKFMDSKMIVLNPTHSIKRILELSKVSDKILVRCD